MYQLRDYQQDAVDQTFRMLTNAEIPEAKPVICLPTGAGKSLVIAELARRAVADFKGRVLVLQHRKELIEQNAEKIQGLLPGYNVGLYSAGLKRTDTLNNIVVAGIQSVHRKALDLGRRNLVLIDECHLVPERDEGMYRSFLSDMADQVRCRIVGLTATPYRTNDGKIYGNDKQFSHLINPVGADIPNLIERGFLCKLINSSAQSSVDTSGLHVRAGEFVTKECEMLFQQDKVVLEACEELLAKTQDRHSVLIFSTSIMHAKAIQEIISRSTGQLVDLICGETAKGERDVIIERFRRLQVKYLVNVDVLTTGFDAPVVDCVAILRATASPGLYAQIVGRGMRPHESKQDCLILDFGENIKRHGPIDRIRLAKKDKQEQSPSDKSDEDDETKTEGKMCPGCEVYVDINELQCECGFRFPLRFRHGATTDNAEIISSDKERIYCVVNVFYRVVRPKNQSPCMLVEYAVTSSGKTRMENDMPTQWIKFDSVNSNVDRFCRQWWKKRTDEPFPSDAYEAVKIASSASFKKPRVISASRPKDKSCWKIEYPGWLNVKEEVANETVS